MSKEINTKVSGEGVVTATTTAKQERYEKKMAKYAANKARREQMKNEKAANRQKNEHRNQSRSLKGFRLIKSSVSNEDNATDSRYEDLFVDLANEWRTSNKPYVASETLVAYGEMGIIGAFRYGETGIFAKEQIFWIGFSDNNPIARAWDDFAERLLAICYSGNTVYVNRYLTNDKYEANNAMRRDLIMSRVA